MPQPKGKGKGKGKGKKGKQGKGKKGEEADGLPQRNPMPPPPPPRQAAASSSEGDGLPPRADGLPPQETLRPMAPAVRPIAPPVVLVSAVDRPMYPYLANEVRHCQEWFAHFVGNTKRIRFVAIGRHNIPGSNHHKYMFHNVRFDFLRRGLPVPCFLAMF